LEAESRKTSEDRKDRGKVKFSRIRVFVLKIIPTNYGEESKLGELTVMGSAVVGVAGGEVFVRWLAGVKNTMNATVVKSPQ
jgi:hypothetical protein